VERLIGELAGHPVSLTNVRDPFVVLLA